MEIFGLIWITGVGIRNSTQRNPNYNRMVGVDKIIRKFSGHAEQKAEVNRYWQSLSVGERLAAVWEATAAAYAFKGIHYDATRRSPATLTRIQRPRG